MNSKKEKMFSDTAGKTLLVNRIAWIALVLIMIFTGLVRYRLLSVPLERDEGEYAYAGQLILEGVPPYSEVYGMKFPGIYGAYAAILAVFGPTIEGIHTGLLVLNEITIVLVFLLAKRITNTSIAAFSAAVFALFSISQSVEGMFANAEHFVIVFAVAGLLVMLRALDRNSLCGLFIAGLLLGISFAMKQHGFAFAAVAVLYLVVNALFPKPVLWRKEAVRIIVLITGVMTVAACLCLALVWAGVFHKFWFWSIDYARMYISQRSFQEGWQEFVQTSLAILRSSPLLWVMCGIGLICLAAGSFSKTQKLFLFLFTLFSFLSICPGLYFRPHYFVMLLPCAALLAGVAIQVFYQILMRFLPYTVSVCLVVLWVAVCLVQSGYQQRNMLFRLSPLEICRFVYGLNPFPESLPISSFIRDHTTPDDTIAIIGSEPQICFYANRRSASGHIYMYPLMEKHPFALQMQKDFIRETETKKPKYFVFIFISSSWSRREYSYNLVMDWADQCLYSSNFKPVYTVELYDDQSIIHQSPEIQWPVKAENWVAIFERKAK